MTRPLVIGAGPNGLTAAFYLARAGMRPLVLEAADRVGGGALLSPNVTPLLPAIVRDMKLDERVHFIRPDPRLVALQPDGPALTFFRDPARTSEEIRRHSAHDADRYVEFCATLGRFGGLVARLADMTPPSVDAPTAAELWSLLKAGRHFRSLGRKNAFRLLRWGPMAAADFVAEWFETDLLQAAVAARGIYGSSQGPWSAGTTAALLLSAAHDPMPGGGTLFVKGGPDTLATAMRDAAREAGAEIRVDAPVARMLVRDGSVRGVALEDGTEIPGAAVLSSADPKRTFLSLMDPLDLEPTFLSRVRNYRSTGSAAKVILTLGAPASFAGAGNGSPPGRVHIGPTIDYLERAFDASKYGEISTEPYLEVTCVDPSLAAGGKHVLCVHAQFAPYKLNPGLEWSRERDSLLRAVISTLERYAPGLGSLVEDEQVLTPMDLESRYRLTGGHAFHGEHALDQLFTMRPFLGCARYRGPLRGLYLGSAGTHPGGWVAGGPGHHAARQLIEDRDVSV